MARKIDTMYMYMCLAQSVCYVRARAVVDWKGLELELELYWIGQDLGVYVDNGDGGGS